MKKIFLDTNGYSEMKKATNPALLEMIQAADIIGINSIVLGELYAGFYYGKKTKKNIDELKEFLNSSRVYLLNVTEITAEFYGLIYKQLREIGKPIPTNDLWIAASCLEHGFPLYTIDEHFSYVKELVLVKA